MAQFPANRCHHPIEAGDPLRGHAPAWLVDGVVHVPCFLRGDGNDDGATDIADPVYVLNHLFGGGPAPSCMQTADANDDNAVNVADPVYLLNHLFGSGGALNTPVAECGADPTPAANAEEKFSCAAYPPCDP